MYQQYLYKILTFLSPNFYKEINDHLVNRNKLNIIDVGFYRGSFTKDLLSKLLVRNDNLDCVVYSFDPNSSVDTSGFKKFTEKNSIQWSHKYLAIGNKKSLEKFSILKKFPSSGSSINNILIDSLWFKTRRFIVSPFTSNENSFIEIEVDVDTLDNLFTDKDKVDLIKIDVEGYTYEVLQGAKRIIKNNNPIIQLEILSKKKDFKKKEKEILEYLNSLGYKDFLTKKHYTTHIFSDIICCDYLFTNLENSLT